jgi:Ring finger domain
MREPTSERTGPHLEPHTIGIRGRKPVNKLEAIERFPCVSYGDWMARHTMNASGIGEKNSMIGLPATDKNNEQQSVRDSNGVRAPLGGDKNESIATVDITDYARDDYVISKVQVDRYGRRSSDELLWAVSLEDLQHYENKQPTGNCSDNLTEQIRSSALTCAICLEDFRQSDSVREFYCGDIFHATCIDKWLAKRGACCPVCKMDCRPPHLECSV